MRAAVVIAAAVLILGAAALAAGAFAGHGKAATPPIHHRPPPARRVRTHDTKKPVFHPGHERPLAPLRRLSSLTTFCPILMFHYIRRYDKPSDPLGIGLSTSPKWFAHEMAFIRHARYHTVTLTQLAQHIRYGRKLPSHCIAITLDDGYEDQYANGFRIIHHYRLKATFFIVSSFVGTPGHVTWAQVERMAEAGMDIGVHTIHHYDLTTLSSRDSWQEIRHSKIVIERHVHRRLHVFAYPYGGFNQSIANQVRRAGYMAAVSTLGGTLHAQHSLFWLFREDMINLSNTATISYLMAAPWGNPFAPSPSHP